MGNGTYPLQTVRRGPLWCISSQSGPGAAGGALIGAGAGSATAGAAIGGGAGLIGGYLYDQYEKNKYGY
ncbi:MAG: glycine zipper domain-containing protein [Deltaproteobacteria bacterium]